MMARTLKNVLERKIGGNVPRAFDIVGEIAIIEIPKGMSKKEKVIGEAILGLHKHIKTVVRKVGRHKGKLRLQKYKVIAGDKEKETLYKENRCRFRLNIDKTYFSVRLANERNRIAKMVRKGEAVLVMFSGAGPYPIVLAKNSKAKKIVGVELNKDAHKYGVENLRLNKIWNVELYQGDVRRKVPGLKGRFDRIIMPLPKGGERYLGVALRKIKKKGMIHFYDFLEEGKVDGIKEKIVKACRKSKKRCKIIRVARCGQWGPYIHRVCVDFRVL